MIRREATDRGPAWGVHCDQCDLLLSLTTNQTVDHFDAELLVRFVAGDVYLTDRTIRRWTPSGGTSTRGPYQVLCRKCGEGG